MSKRSECICPNCSAVLRAEGIESATKVSGGLFKMKLNVKIKCLSCGAMLEKQFTPRNEIGQSRDLKYVAASYLSSYHNA